MAIRFGEFHPVSTSPEVQAPDNFRLLLLKDQKHAAHVPNLLVGYVLRSPAALNFSSLDRESGELFQFMFE